MRLRTQAGLKSAKVTKEYYGQGGILGNPALADRFAEMLRALDDVPFDFARSRGCGRSPQGSPTHQHDEH